MARQKLHNKNTRKLQKSAKKCVYVTLPIDIIRKLKWRIKQKVIAKKWGRGILIKDWEKK